MQRQINNSSATWIAKIDFCENHFAIYSLSSLAWRNEPKFFVFKCNLASSHPILQLLLLIATCLCKVAAKKSEKTKVYEYDP